MKPPECDALLKTALSEDAARADITSRAVLPRKSRIQAALIAKEAGILAGIDVAARVFRLQDNGLSLRAVKHDGDSITSGHTVLTVEGHARSIFAAERVALNCLGHLSGIATLTRRYVQAIRGSQANILDTRKTLPGLRALEKYAVRVGGGVNHRSDLQEAILIKTNHLEVLRQVTRDKRHVSTTSLIRRTITQAKRAKPKRFVEIEVTNLEEFQAALTTTPNAILLDNWRIPDIRKAVALKTRGPWSVVRGPSLEVSGGVTLANVRAIAATGVDRISIGRLTHSAPSLDLSLNVI